MKTYEVIFDKENNKGVYALSCVENPAMQDTWLTLAEHHQEIQFSAVDEEKRLLLGAALIPNKKVYRKDEKGNEFYIVFSEKTIEDCAHAFIKNGFQNNSSENHEIKMEGVSVVEAWTVQDPLKDKSAAYGKTYDKGTWVTMMKVDNDDTWEKAKTGKLNGFSIDGLFSLKEIGVELKSNEMNTKDIIDAIRDAFKPAEVKLGSLKLKDGKTKVVFDGDEPIMGQPVFFLSEDKKEKITVPQGKYETETGIFLNVDKNGLLAEEEVQEPEAEKVEEKELETALSAFLAELKEMKDEFNKDKEAFKVALAAEKKRNAELEAKLEEKPAAEKITLKTELIAEPKNTKERLFNVAMSTLNN